MSGFRFKLPEGSRMLASEFTYGVATASFQVEGATHEGGRLPCIWDTFCATPGKVKNGDTGERACEHYHRWEEDFALIEGLQVDAYRFSIAWPRVMKEDGTPNAQGLDFYRRLLDRLNERGIQPHVTLYHWDLPQHLEDRGGWLSRETPYRFQDYADLVTRELGDQVHAYSTVNEPWCSAFLGYGYGVHAPGLKSMRYARQASHHLLLAHGLGMEVLRSNAPRAQSGIVLNMGPMTPKTDRYDDLIASKLAEAGGNHWFIEPVLEGRYPHVFNRFNPREEPLVLEGDLEKISVPVDFIGINYYTRNISTYDPEHFLKLHPNPDAEHTDIGWEIYPQGLTDLLVDLHQQYRLPPLMITENGAACADRLLNGQVEDDQRCRYYDLHLNAVHQAIEQGVNITGYFAWSLLDNFEWAEGYDKRFGIVHVDYDTQQRTVKESAKAFQRLMQERRLVAGAPLPSPPLSHA
jgi:beta-glucosidase